MCNLTYIPILCLMSVGLTCLTELSRRSLSSTMCCAWCWISRCFSFSSLVRALCESSRSFSLCSKSDASFLSLNQEAEGTSTQGRKEGGKEIREGGEKRYGREGREREGVIVKLNVVLCLDPTHDTILNPRLP